MSRYIQDKKTGAMLGSEPGPGKSRTPTSSPDLPKGGAGASSHGSADYATQHRVLREKEAVAAEQVAAATAPNPGMLRSRPKATPHSREGVTPGGYTLSAHLVKQAKAKGIALRDLVDCVDSPTTTYESHRYPGQVKHIRGDICVAVDPVDRRAITVFLDRVETDLRHDQRNDVDARKWDQRRRRS